MGPKCKGSDLGCEEGLSPSSHLGQAAPRLPDFSRSWVTWRLPFCFSSQLRKADQTGVLAAATAGAARPAG